METWAAPGTTFAAGIVVQPLDLGGWRMAEISRCAVTTPTSLSWEGSSVGTIKGREVFYGQAYWSWILAISRCVESAHEQISFFPFPGHWRRQSEARVALRCSRSRLCK